jgi:hypothetical protein
LNLLHASMQEPFQHQQPVQVKQLEPRLSTFSSAKTLMKLRVGCG